MIRGESPGEKQKGEQKMTNKELKEIYDQVKHCKKGYCCQQQCKNGMNLIEIGYNKGLYGWNWTAYLDQETSTLYVSNYRNVPNYIKEK